MFSDHIKGSCVILFDVRNDAKISEMVQLFVFANGGGWGIGGKLQTRVNAYRSASLVLYCNSSNGFELRHSAFDVAQQRLLKEKKYGNKVYIISFDTLQTILFNR